MSETKNKEPAQSANCTSSKKISTTYDDTSCCRVCQEQLLKDLENVKNFLEHPCKPALEIYIYKVGKAIGYLEKMCNDLKAGDNNV